MTLSRKRDYTFSFPLLIILILLIYLFISFFSYCLWIWLRSSRRICPVQFATGEFVFVEDHGWRSFDRADPMKLLPVTSGYCFSRTKNTYCDISGSIFFYEIRDCPSSKSVTHWSKRFETNATFLISWRIVSRI